MIPTAVVEATALGVIDVSAVVATKTRAMALQRTLESLGNQSVQPAEIIIVDASEDWDTRALCEKGLPRLRSRLRWIRAKQGGAASQRNEGIALAARPIIWFFDDDIVFRDNCVANLWNALQTGSEMGGVSAMIVNQLYQTPGNISRILFTLLHGKRETTFAGKVIGPAVNLLPEDGDGLPAVAVVEWLNTTCTMYRREALPSPPFDSFFTGYSLMEDLAVSLEVGKKWKLANARTARIVHDSQSGDYKSDVRARSRMELVNRHHVMTTVMGRRSSADYMRLGLWEFFSLASTLNSKKGFNRLPAAIVGKRDGLRQILSKKSAL
jgi:glycosyltransferase involved in cell wall biosynthesis